MIPYFSIILPTFNSELNIEYSISSVLNQSYGNFEILIMDGFSTDNTLSIVNKILDIRVKIYSESDINVYDAMNKGLSYAKGEWVYFLGSDDFLFNDQVLFYVWEITNRSKQQVIYGDVLIKGNTGWAKDGEIYAGPFTKNRMLVKAICHQAIFYKRIFILENSLSFDTRYFVSADWKFNLSCRRLTKFKYVRYIIAVFQAGGISSLESDGFRDQIRIEFHDLLPSKLELSLKKFIKRIIFYAKKVF